jgi:hypothetical protein
MKRREFVSALGASLINMGMIPPEAMAAGAATYMLGDTKVTLNSSSSGSGPTYFGPHSNETTSINAATAIAKARGGRVFWLTHGDGQRNITFVLEGKTYVVDPNRIFSSKGAKDSLNKLGGSSPKAIKAVRGLAAFVLDKLFAGHVRPLVGLHNNTDGNLSAKSYKSGDNKKEAKEVYIHPGLDVDDFFFVTSKASFETLKQKGFNVVLQAWPIADDGSLSVYCQKRGVPYINVEAQAKHSSQQQKMLKALY